MRGDRFKRRLPKFIGNISDLDDTFYAEDKEFYRIDGEMDDFLYGLTASLLKKTKNPNKYLTRFEKDYGLESIGDSICQVYTFKNTRITRFCWNCISKVAMLI